MNNQFDVLEEKRKNNIVEYYMNMGYSQEEAEFIYGGENKSANNKGLYYVDELPFTAHN